MAAPSHNSLSAPLLQSHKEDHFKTTELPLPHTSDATSPYLTSNWFKSLTFMWLDPLLHLGNTRTLQIADVPHLAPEDQAARLYKAFSEAWAEQVKGSPSLDGSSSQYCQLNNKVPKGSALSEPSIIKALAKCFWKLSLRSGIYALVRAVAVTSGPIFLLLFVNYTAGEELFPGEGYVLVGGLFLAKMIESLAQRHWYLGCRRLGSQLRSAVMAAVFDKELRLSSIGRRNHAAGEIVNYIAVDAYRLGEIPKQSGSVQVVGRIAYVSQNAWIQGGTVRDNILFGRPFQKEYYQRTLKACAFEEDIRGFPFGDLTEIGERGLNMSGGQKQRIQLARAVYSDADIYLLDDPFSAVDAHTAADLFKNCVMGALMKKTVVLVTHQVEFLPAVDCILVMQGGEIQQSGRYHDLLQAGETFEQLVNAHQDALTNVSFGDTLHRHDAHGEVNHMQRKLSRRASSQDSNQGEAVQLVQEEEMETGDMGLEPYKEYVTISKGVWMFVITTVWEILFVVLQTLSNFWLADEVSNPSIPQRLLVGVYAALSVASGVFVHLRSQYIVWLGLKASKAFFHGLIQAVFRAPMSFFDSTPTGRILSRVSTDLSILDLDIPFSIGFVMTGSIQLLGVLVIIATVTWEILLVALPMLYIAHRLQRYYVRSGQELLRINATTKAPIVNFSGEAAQGAATIRAFQMVERLKEKNLSLIDNDSSLYFHANAALEWLIMRLEFLSNVVLCATGLFLVIFPAPSSGFAGLALTYGISLSSVQVFFVQWQCKLVSYIVSVERINQYMHLPSEAPAVIESRCPAKQWPSKGGVVFEDLKIRYQPTSPLVLRGVTCTFEGGKRVGVVGRTGSGKTTLINALFRLVEPAGGKIVIDDVDISSIGLHDLRSRLGIIPQEPILFRGTVRTNLDPLNQYSDEAIWQALDRCQLGKDIRDSQSQLEAPVSDDGENWSAGQRQLFCLGRVLLKQSRVLVLDEATASVDSRTDALLQKVIREEFIDCTVITVAHRIPTVIDSDMVLALQDGKLIEYDTPARLLENENSLFTKLVKEYWAHVNDAGSKKF